MSTEAGDARGTGPATTAMDVAGNAERAAGQEADLYSPGEWRRVAGWCVVILAASCLPYLLAWAATPAGYVFGGLVANPLDGQAYLARMREGWLGAWQFHLAHTPEPHDGTYTYLYYLALGHLARIADLPLALVFHLARLAGGLALLLALYAFIARLTAGRRARSLAFWLAAFGGGLGWLGALLGRFPVDLWVPEGFTFYSLLANPHFPLALALMLAILGAVAWPRTGARSWAVAGSAGLALAVVQPFALLPVYGAIGLYLPLRGRYDGAWLRRAAAAAAAMAIFSAPVLVYDFLAYRDNPVLAGWAGQNVSLMPPAADVLLGFGPLLVLALPGLLWALRRRDPGGTLLAAWSIACLALAYTPLELQRRFLMGLGLPLGMLAGLSVAQWGGAGRSLISTAKQMMRDGRGEAERARGPRLRDDGWARGPVMAAAGVPLLGSLALLLILTLPATNGDPASETFRMLRVSTGEEAAMRWLLQNGAGEVALASPRTGAFLPGQAGVRSFAGHPVETVDADVKMAQAEDFFAGRLSADAWQDLRTRYHIRYVFAGPAERLLAGPAGILLPAPAQPVYKQDDITIYLLP